MLFLTHQADQEQNQSGRGNMKFENQVRGVMDVTEFKEGFSSLKDVYSERYEFQNSNKPKDYLVKKIAFGSRVNDNELEQTFKMSQSVFINTLRQLKQIDNDEQIRDENAFYAHGKYHKFSKNALGCLTNRNPIRKKLVWLITWRGFDIFIFVTIIVNSLFLGIYDYLYDQRVDLDLPQPWQNVVTNKSENVFIAIFVAEAFIKILGMGFIWGKNSYLSDPWNWLDFVVVVTSIMSSIPSMSNFTVIRTFRVFRPLKSLKWLPTMRILIQTLLTSISSLGGILCVSVFFFLIFAIQGLSFWPGLIHQRCRMTELPLANGTWPIVAGDYRLCGMKGNGRQCPVPYTCGSLLQVYLECQYNSSFVAACPNIELIEAKTDSYVLDLNWGYTNFDNLMFAFLSIFQCVTLEGWTKIMDIYADAFQPVFVNVYFIIFVMLCNSFVLQLTVAVMLRKYQEILDSDHNQNYKRELVEYGVKLNLPLELVEFIVEHNNVGLQKTMKSKGLVKYYFKKILNNFHFSSTLSLPETKYYESRCTKGCFRIISSPIFNTFINLVIVSNTVILSMAKYPPLEQDLQKIFSYLNYVFTAIFLLEIILKVMGLGLKGFSKEKFNIFDLIIVLISIIEIILSSDKSSISSLRTFRLFRILNILKIESLKILIDMITFTLPTIINYSILMLIFVYVFALLGMQFFAGKLRFHPETNIHDHTQIHNVPRSNFDNLLWSCITIMQIIFQYEWNYVMYDCMRSVGPYSSIFFIALILFGSIIMVNLFLAIILGNFEIARKYNIKKNIFNDFQRQFQRKRTLGQAIDNVLGDLAHHVKEKILIDKPVLGLGDLPSLKQIHAKSQTGPRSRRTTIFRQRQLDQEAIEEEDSYQKSEQMFDSAGEYDDYDDEEEEQSKKKEGLKRRSSIKKLRTTKVEFKQRDLKKQDSKVLSSPQFATSELQRYPNEFRGRKASEEQPKPPSCLGCLKDHLLNSSLFIFHRKSAIRRFFIKLTIKSDIQQEILRKAELRRQSRQLQQSNLNHQTIFMEQVRIQEKLQNKQKDPSQYFENFILMTIICSSVLLAIDNPLDDPNTTQKQIISIIDQIFTFIFLIEAIIKIIAMGFIQNNSKNVTPYIRSYWNILDLLVVSTSLIDFMISETTTGNTVKLKSLKSLRALRALRPLRMISRNEGLRIVVNALIISITSMINAIFVSFLFLMIFGIIGNSFFGGKFYKCTLPDSAQIITKFDCLDQGGDWLNQKQNFDNFFKSLETLFEIMTAQGWLQVMHDGIDITEIDLQPKRNNKPYFLIYFLAYIFIGVLFMWNIFAGVIIDNFNIIKDKNQLGGQQATEGQKTWINTQRLLMSKQLKKKEVIPKGDCQAFVYRFMVSPCFDYIIIVLIILNNVVMAMRYDTMSREYSLILDYLNYALTAFFNLECVLKIMVLGRNYFSQKWNQFDLLIVLGTDASLVINRFHSKMIVPTSVTVMRGFRIMKVFSIMKSAKNIQILLDTLFNILPQISNIILLLFLVLFIYASLGINLFSGVILQEYYRENVNFTNFFMAIELLIRCITQGEWNEIMWDLTIQGSYKGTKCIPSQTYQSQQQLGIIGCGTNIAYPYFISFMIIVAMIVMNLTIASVIEGFETARKENFGLLLSSDIEKLLDLWKEYDPQGTGFIQVEELIFFLYELPSPFTLPEQEERLSMKQEEAENAIVNILRKSHNSVEKIRKKYLFKKDNSSYVPILEALRVLDRLSVPIYQNERVHFKDVILKVVAQIFEKQGLDYKLSIAAKKRLNRHWNKRFTILRKIKKKTQMRSATFFAGKIIWERFKLNRVVLNQRKQKMKYLANGYANGDENHENESRRKEEIKEIQPHAHDPSMPLPQTEQSTRKQVYLTRSQLPDNFSYNWVSDPHHWAQDLEQEEIYEIKPHPLLPLPKLQKQYKSTKQGQRREFEVEGEERHNFTDKSEESKYETLDEDYARKHLNFFIIPKVRDDSIQEEEKGQEGTERIKSEGVQLAEMLEADSPNLFAKKKYFDYFASGLEVELDDGETIQNFEHTMEEDLELPADSKRNSLSSFSKKKKIVRIDQSVEEIRKEKKSLGVELREVDGTEEEGTGEEMNHKRSNIVIRISNLRE